MLQKTPALLSTSLREIARTLASNGVEIFAERESELQIAERVRIHFMDSGVRVRSNESRIEIAFVATATRSEHPSAQPAELFDSMRETIGAAATARGYRELGASTNHATDPQNRKRVLDVFYQLEYSLALNDLTRLVEEVRWALDLDKSLPAS